MKYLRAAIISLLATPAVIAYILGAGWLASVLIPYVCFKDWCGLNKDALQLLLWLTFSVGPLIFLRLMPHDEDEQEESE